MFFQDFLLDKYTETLTILPANLTARYPYCPRRENQDCKSPNATTIPDYAGEHDNASPSLRIEAEGHTV